MLVLPRGTYEVEPSLEYTYRGSNALNIVDVGGVPQVARENVKRDRLEARLALRAGLPASSAVEVRLPYVLTRDDRSIAGQSPNTSTDHGTGDIQIGVTKQLVDDRPSRPGWLASVNWKLPSGRYRVGEGSPGGGFHSVQAGLTFTKRQDPLVFFGTGSYTYVRPKVHGGADIDPGDMVGFKFGTILAASPSTSIRGGLEVSRSGRMTANGTSVAGSDAMVATLQFGLGVLVSRRSLLDIQLNVGVTPDAPDLGVSIALPIRF